MFNIDQTARWQAAGSPSPFGYDVLHHGGSDDTWGLKRTDQEQPLQTAERFGNGGSGLDATDAGAKRMRFAFVCLRCSPTPDLTPGGWVRGVALSELR